LDSLVSTLASSAPTVTTEMINVCEKIAYTWPPASRFPGIDLLRVCALYTPLVHSGHEGFLSLISEKSGFPAEIREVWTKPQETNAMLGLRLLCNVLAKQKVSGEEVIKRVQYTWQNVTSAGARSAFVSVLYNVTCAGIEDDVAVEIVSAVLEMIKNEDDVETLFRALVVLGKVVAGNALGREAAVLMNAEKIVSGVIGGGEERVRGVGAEVVSALKG
jgi:phospholipase A-2-activating protein